MEGKYLYFKCVILVIFVYHFSVIMHYNYSWRRVLLKAVRSRPGAVWSRPDAFWAALQIQDRSPESRPVTSLKQSQTQLTRPVATGLGMQRAPGLWKRLDAVQNRATAKRSRLESNSCNRECGNYSDLSC